MKCDDCLNQLAEYIDGEVVAHEAERISAHLINCAGCSSEFESLTAEQEIFARYDRELEISPAMWSAIQARTVSESRPVNSSSKFNARSWVAGLFALPRLGFAFSGALAVVIIAVVVGVMYLKTREQTATPETVAGNYKPTVPPVSQAGGAVPSVTPTAPVEEPFKESVSQRKTPKGTHRLTRPDDPGVLFKDVAYSDLAERDTAEHIQQAENLLRSIRSLQSSDDDGEIDVSYEKAMSQRLLSENQVLRRDAEAAGKFPAKELLGDLEPFLIDISNLPDKATPDKLRALKDRVQKTEIVAALVSY